MKQTVCLVMALALCLILASAAMAGELDARLFKAAQQGDVAAVQALLARGANLNARDETNGTVLKMAAMYGKTEVVRFLLGKGADANTKDKFGATALMVSGNTDIARLLIERGADVNAKSIGGLTALMLAAASCNIDMCRLLTDKGADVNAKEDYEGATALMYAAGKKLDEDDNHWNIDAARAIVRLLIDKGADVNAKEKKGHTALMWAVGGDITRLLIEKGADVNASSYGLTALSLANWAKDTEKIRLLEQAGAK